MKNSKHDNYIDSYEYTYVIIQNIIGEINLQI